MTAQCSHITLQSPLPLHPPPPLGVGASGSGPPERRRQGRTPHAPGPPPNAAKRPTDLPPIPCVCRLYHLPPGKPATPPRSRPRGPERPREAPSTHQHPLLPPPCSAPPPHTRGAPLHLRSPHPVSFQFIPPSSTTAGPSLPRTLPPDLIAQCSHSTLQSPLPATHPLRPR